MSKPPPLEGSFATSLAVIAWSLRSVTLREIGEFNPSPQFRRPVKLKDEQYDARLTDHSYIFCNGGPNRDRRRDQKSRAARGSRTDVLRLLDDPQVQQKIVTLLRRWPLAYPKSNPSLGKPYFYKLENRVMLENTDIDHQQVDLHLTTKIVQSYVLHHAVGVGQVSELITSVHGALSQVLRPNPPEKVLTPAVSVRQSVRHDYVVCLDCGYRGRMLRRHISQQHGLSPDEYLKRWGLRREHPLTAPGYSEQRSSMAKELGLGRKVKAKPKAKVGPATAPASTDVNPKSETKPRRRQSNGSTSKSGVGEKAAAASTPKQKSRSSSRQALR